jgi:hypothetical protein
MKNKTIEKNVTSMMQKLNLALRRGFASLLNRAGNLHSVFKPCLAKSKSAARAWVEPLLRQLRHGEENEVLQALDDLPAWCAARNRTNPPEVGRERNYFQNHRKHVHYEAIATRGCPIGSGDMESFCSQLQGRFKRCGQFWSPSGMADLLALEIARRNLDWDALWLKN